MKQWRVGLLNVVPALSHCSSLEEPIYLEFKHRAGTMKPWHGHGLQLLQHLCIREYSYMVWDITSTHPLEGLNGLHKTRLLENDSRQTSVCREQVKQWRVSQHDSLL